MDANWLHVALAAGLVYTALLAWVARKRRWTWAAMAAAMANFFYVLLNLAAPFRGALDPGYAGYKMGLLDVAPGPLVALASGAVVVTALTAACLALLNRHGKSMALIALLDIVLLLVIGLPETLSGLMAPESYRLELGEYLQVPGLLAVVMVGALLCLPLIYSVIWSSRRMQPRPAGNRVATAT